MFSGVAKFSLQYVMFVCSSHLPMKQPFQFLPIGNLYHRFNSLNKSWKLKEITGQLERVNPIEIKPMLKSYTI